MLTEAYETLKRLGNIKREALDEYRVAVFAAVEDGAPDADALHRVLTLSGKTIDDFRRDVSQLESRKSAVEDFEKANELDRKRAEDSKRWQEASAHYNRVKVECNKKLREAAAPLEQLRIEEEVSRPDLESRRLRQFARRILLDTADPAIEEEIDELSREVEACRERLREGIRLLEQSDETEAEIGRLEMAIESQLDADKVPALKSKLERARNRMKAIDEAQQETIVLERRRNLLQARISHLQASKLDWRSAAIPSE